MSSGVGVSVFRYSYFFMIADVAGFHINDAFGVSISRPINYFVYIK